MSSVPFIRHRSAARETNRQSDTTNLYSCKSDSYVIRGSYVIAAVVKLPPTERGDGGTWCGNWRYIYTDT